MSLIQSIFLTSIIQNQPIINFLLTVLLANAIFGLAYAQPVTSREGHGLNAGIYRMVTEETNGHRKVST